MGLFDKIAEKLDSKTPHDHGGTSEAHLQPGCLCFDLRTAVVVCSACACAQPTGFKMHLLRKLLHRLHAWFYWRVCVSNLPAHLPRMQECAQ